MERDAKQRSLEQLAATHVHPPIVLNGWRDAAVDLSRPSDGSPGNSSPFPLNTNMPKLGTVNTLQGSLGMDLSGILQAGLIHPVTGQIVNGSLRRDDAAMRRRRGRRKNVEGMDLIFVKERPLPTRLQVGLCSLLSYGPNGVSTICLMVQLSPASSAGHDNVGPPPGQLGLWWSRQEQILLQGGKEVFPLACSTLPEVFESC